ncbi:MAG: DNA-processing protein DprA [Patescibacteria group bacterium]
MEIKKLPRDAWPPLLSEINDPPKELYVEGKIDFPDRTWLTVVGSRRASTYGTEVVQTLIAALAGQPVVIVSGLAIGIDTITHKAALKNDLPTLAVPGSGLDREVLHPSSNSKLADEIVAHGGALLSELEPKCPAGIHTFPKRNRLMAGMSKAILIIEAGKNSGTLITARLATDYNRDVLAVPGSIFHPGAYGTNTLIRDGATPITSGDDLLLALGFKLNSEKPAQERTDLTDQEKIIVDLLAVEPLIRDDLIRATGLPTSDANTLLAVMEIKGLIREVLGEVRLV